LNFIIEFRHIWVYNSANFPDGRRGLEDNEEKSAEGNTSTPKRYYLTVHGILCNEQLHNLYIRSCRRYSSKPPL
jgi:hypothetical protein